MLMENRREVLKKYKESVELNTDFSYLESYWRKGGTYELPVELVNDLTGRIEELVAEVKELNDSLTWWINRYNANEKILERYRTDENGSSKDATGDNQDS